MKKLIDICNRLIDDIEDGLYDEYYLINVDSKIRRNNLQITLKYQQLQNDYLIAHEKLKRSYDFLIYRINSGNSTTYIFEAYENATKKFYDYMVACNEFLNYIYMNYNV